MTEICAESAYVQKLRIFSRDTPLYLATAALFGFTVFGGIYSVLLNLYLLRLGHGPQFIGLMNTAGAGAFALFSAPAGAIGGRWGMRRPMIIGLILTMVSSGLLPTTQLTLGAVSSTWLVVTYGLSGIGTALYMVNGDAFLAGCTGSVVLLGIAARGAVRTFLNVYLDDRLHVPTAQIGTLRSLWSLDRGHPWPARSTWPSELGSRPLASRAGTSSAP